MKKIGDIVILREKGVERRSVEEEIKYFYVFFRFIKIIINWSVCLYVEELDGVFGVEIVWVIDIVGSG